MIKIIQVVGSLFVIVSYFIPATIIYICAPFIALMGFIKIIREVH